MRIALTGILTTMIFAAILGQAAAQSENLKIESHLREQLVNASPANKFIVWVIFVDRPSLDDTPYDGLPPVDLEYVQQVSSISGVNPRHVDELLNGLSVEATAQAIYDIAALPFVSEIQSVPSGCVIPEGCEIGEPTQTQANAVRFIPIIVVLAMVGLAFGVIVLVSSVMLGLRYP